MEASNYELDVLTKTVQELSRLELHELPEKYIRKEDERPINSSPPPSPIPVIDLQHLFSSGETKKIEVEKLKSALQSWGFFQAINHGIPYSFLDLFREVIKEFFELPLEEKNKWSRTVEVLSFEGREGYGRDPLASENETLDWSDRLVLLVLPEDQRNLRFWPENPTIFRDILHEYSMKVKEVADKIFRIMEDLLDLKENYFTDYLGRKAVLYGRANYYPPCSRPDLVLGFKPHSDKGALTVLLQDREVEGLQVLKDDKWVQVPMLPHALVINLGDVIEILSNGVFKSLVHRVVTNEKKERMSFALFSIPETWKEIEPAESLIHENNPSLYKKVGVSDYFRMFFESNSEGKRAINSLKISHDA